MTTPAAGTQLVAALRRTLGPRWDFQADGARLAIRHRDAGSPYRPSRRAFTWADLLAGLEGAFASVGVPRSSALPLRWRRETDLVISAVQALDPYLKHRRPYVYREGYLPQPVVRFTGRRDEYGALRDGFLTSFVNTSHVRRVTEVGDIAVMLDQWLTVLSRLGLHARHLNIRAELAVWQRQQVEGITLHYNYAGTPLGDLVWLWNAADPTYTVGDLGTGLERLAWIITGWSWPNLIYGDLATYTDAATLDAIRTATLVAGSGIQPTHRGPGTALRRLIRNVPSDMAVLGIDAAVRAFHAYWQPVARLQSAWPCVSTSLSAEIKRNVARGAGEPFWTACPGLRARGAA